MKGDGQALCNGAVSVINAFATGKGAALGVELWTRARVALHDAPGELTAINTDYPDEPGLLMVRSVQLTLEHYGMAADISGEVVTWSNIPPTVGLKSSSAAANAVVLATMSALDKHPESDVAIQIATQASVEAGVSLTGAYDDAYACYHGGGVITDNVRRKVEKKFYCPPGTRVLILVPPRKRYTGQLSKSTFSPIRGIIEVAYREASDSNPWHAMTLNGLAYSAILGEDTKPVIDALAYGAIAAGISGKGPAVAALVPEGKVANVLRAFEKFAGKTIETLPNLTEAIVEH